MIRRRLFRDANESFETGATGARCAGESCPHFYQAAGETVEIRHQNAKTQCGGNCAPPVGDDEDEDEHADAEAEELFEDIAALVAEADAGLTVEFESVEAQRLYVYWRGIEKQIRHVWRLRHQAWLKAQFEKQ